MPGMLRTMEEVWSSDRHVVFGASCYRHGILMNKEWTDVKVDNVSAQEQLLTWVNDDIRSIKVSWCTGVNCQDSCPSVDTSEDASCP